MNKLISVVIPTHNPDKERLHRVLKSLQSQTLSLSIWEVVVVDNASSDTSYLSFFDLSWHPNARIIYENQLGLTKARLAGIKATIGKYIVFVDDDNVLEPTYLANAVSIYEKEPKLGAIGGKSLPEYEREPEPWFSEITLGMGCRDFGEQVQTYFPVPNIKLNHYPECSPVGAGMVLRRSALVEYVRKIEEESCNTILDRTGKSLTSGGDCDINLTLLNKGWGVGYFPSLKLTHVIPASRLTESYLARLNRAVTRSWVGVLNLHGIRPWPAIPKWSLSSRKAKSYLSCKPWRGSVEYIKWQGSCGLLEGQCYLNKKS